MKREIQYRLISFISRKFVIALIILIGSLFMLYLERISGQAWTIIVSADVITFTASNALSKKYKDYSGDGDAG